MLTYGDQRKILAPHETSIIVTSCEQKQPVIWERSVSGRPDWGFYIRLLNWGY